MLSGGVIGCTRERLERGVVLAAGHAAAAGLVGAGPVLAGPDPAGGQGGNRRGGAWALARYVVGQPDPYFAPLAALLGVYPTVARSLREGVQYVAGFLRRVSFGRDFAAMLRILAGLVRQLADLRSSLPAPRSTWPGSPAKSSARSRNTKPSPTTRQATATRATIGVVEMTLRFEIFPDDLDATVDFYLRVLRFRLIADRRDEPSPYVSLQRGSVRVGAARRAVVPDARAVRRPPAGVELVLEVDDVVAERDQITAAGWPITEDLRDRPWGLRDFRVLDPAGYYLRITDRGPTVTAECRVCGVPAAPRT